MICCSCGKGIDINYGREYWNGIYCKKCADEMLSTTEYIKNYKRIIADLQAENAELRERLSRAVELPSGDRVWFITEDEEGKESYIVSKPTDWLTVDELYEIGKKYFTTCEAAKKAVEELKRRDKNG